MSPFATLRTCAGVGVKVGHVQQGRVGAVVRLCNLAHAATDALQANWQHSQAGCGCQGTRGTRVRASCSKTLRLSTNAAAGQKWAEVGSQLVCLNATTQ